MILDPNNLPKPVFVQLGNGSRQCTQYLKYGGKIYRNVSIVIPQSMGPNQPTLELTNTISNIVVGSYDE